MAKQAIEEKTEKRAEIKAFSFIIFVLFPALAVAIVGTYGLVIWIMQTYGGIPTH